MCLIALDAGIDNPEIWSTHALIMRALGGAQTYARDASARYEMRTCWMGYCAQLQYLVDLFPERYAASVLALFPQTLELPDGSVLPFYTDPVLDADYVDLSSPQHC